MYEERVMYMLYSFQNLREVKSRESCREFSLCLLDIVPKITIPHQWEDYVVTVV